MNSLLIFFALPVATIILAVVLERVWGCYKLVTAFIFAIYLIIVFALFDASYLVYALIYTFLAFVASYLSMVIQRLNQRLDNIENRNCCRRQNGCRCANRCQIEEECNNNANPTNLLTISSSCGNGENNDLLTINTTCARSGENNNNNNANACCNQQNQANARNVEFSARVIPNCNNNGRTGTFRGCYRRRLF